MQVMVVDDACHIMRPTSIFARLEFDGGRFVVPLPPEVIEDLNVRAGDTVEVDVQQFSLTP